MKLGIGIDTGGTYTDAVIYDFTAGEVMGSAKALTTRHDLAVGILQALDSLPAELVAKAELLALSTTLATNACVENKGGQARLIFFGGQEKVITNYGASYGLPPIEEIYLPAFREQPEAVGQDDEEARPQPDWELFRQDVENDLFADLDGVGIVELNSMWHGSLAERTAKEIINSHSDIPVVCGYELFHDLNSLQRGASTLLNARLFPVIKEFLAAIDSSLACRGLSLPKFIVRSDGSLMTDSFANERPVETLISGPAASVMGAFGLTNENNGVVVDIGGTTTDIALVKDSDPVRADGGIHIGGWKTFVKGLYVHTVGLGGDSAVHYKDGRLFLEEYRAVPLCVAAASHPQMVKKIYSMTDSLSYKRPLYEHYIKGRDIAGNNRYSDDEKAICAALDDGPLVPRDLAKALGVDAYTLRMERLLHDGVVQLCSLTPTDIMHLKGDFDRYDKEASLYGAMSAAYNLGLTVDELCDKVYDEFKRKLYVNIVSVLLENEQPSYLKTGLSPELLQYIRECYDMAKEGYQPGFMRMGFDTDFSLIGVGAPTHIFLEDVAKLLGTKAVMPPYFEVANALGAVLGNFYASATVEVSPNYDEGGGDSYTVYSKGKVYDFEEIDEAEQCAEQEAREAAHAAVISHGAWGNVEVTCNIKREITFGRGGVKVYLGSKAVATAKGGVGK